MTNVASAVAYVFDLALLNTMMSDPDVESSPEYTALLIESPEMAERVLRESNKLRSKIARFKDVIFRDSTGQRVESLADEYETSDEKLVLGFKRYAWGALSSFNKVPSGGEKNPRILKRWKVILVEHLKRQGLYLPEILVHLSTDELESVVQTLIGTSESANAMLVEAKAEEEEEAKAKEREAKAKAKAKAAAAASK